MMIFVTCSFLRFSSSAGYYATWKAVSSCFCVLNASCRCYSGYFEAKPLCKTNIQCYVVISYKITQYLLCLAIVHSFFCTWRYI